MTALLKRDAGQRTCIATETRRLGRRLFNQQLWLWGQDIRRPEGNALLTYGFERVRPPGGTKAGNCYRLALRDGACLFLWGFGVCYHRAGRGGVFMPRFTFAPHLTAHPAPPEDAWSAAVLTDYRPPRDAAQWASVRDHFLPALRWIVAYERWILRLRGPDYRRDCVAPWPHHPIPAERIIPEWGRAIEAIEGEMAAFIGARTVQG